MAQMKNITAARNHWCSDDRKCSWCWPPRLEILDKLIWFLVMLAKTRTWRTARNCTRMTCPFLQKNKAHLIKAALNLQLQNQISGIKEVQRRGPETNLYCKILTVRNNQQSLRAIQRKVLYAPFNVRDHNCSRQHLSCRIFSALSSQIHCQCVYELWRQGQMREHSYRGEDGDLRQEKQDWDQTGFWGWETNAIFRLQTKLMSFKILARSWSKM